MNIAVTLAEFWHRHHSRLRLVISAHSWLDEKCVAVDREI